MFFKQIVRSCNFKLWYVYSPVRRSALFINGTKATETFVYINPHVDVNLIEDRDSLKKLFKLRRCNFNADKLSNLWCAYKDLEKQMIAYETKKIELSEELSRCMKENSKGNDIEKYKLKINLLKDNMKKLKPPLWSAEENAIIEYLKIPNSIHTMTPVNEIKIVHSNLSKPSNSKNHLTVGKELSIIEYKNNENYYLKNDGAVFELGAKFYFSKMLKQHRYVQFSNPDFVKSVIVEGCGKDHKDPNSTFILHHNENTKVNPDSRLHLTGGASLESFMAYFGKNIIYPKNFPLRFFAMGRQYNPSPYDENSLFHTSQASVIELFIATKDTQQQDEQLSIVIDILKELYDSFRIHYCLCFEPAHKLNSWESLRLGIQMFSTSLNRYVEVGNVSVSEDYISKRLMFTYSDKNVAKYPHLISGTILNVPKLLACVLEQDKSFALPEKLQIKNWTI